MCPQEAISDVVSVPELPQVEQVEYSSEILEPDSQQMSTQCQCCNPPVLVSCGKQETVVPKLSKDEGDQFLSSILGDDSTNNAAPDESVQHLRRVSYKDPKARSAETVCSDAIGRAVLEEHRTTDRRNRMFEGLLKLTTILNRFDSFITKKTKGFLKGIHLMMGSEENEGKYF
ncbi:uncharacterized protein isoform X2 [Rhodnius prolixus]